MLGSLAVPGAHAPGPPMQAISEKFCRPSGLSLDLRARGLRRFYSYRFAYTPYWLDRMWPRFKELDLGCSSPALHCGFGPSDPSQSNHIPLLHQGRSS